MIVEHTFVTTCEPTQAMQHAARFLGSHGFINNERAAFPIGGQAWTSLEMKRGVKNAGRAKSVAQLPQMARVDYDRGRVSVAISLTEGGAFTGGSRVWPVLAFGLVGAAMMGSQYSGKKFAGHQRAMLMALASGIERAIAGDTSQSPADEEIARVEAEIADDMRRRNRRNWIILGVIIVLMVTIIMLAVFLDH